MSALIFSYPFLMLPLLCVVKEREQERSGKEKWLIGIDFDLKKWSILTIWPSFSSLAGESKKTRDLFEFTEFNEFAKLLASFTNFYNIFGEFIELLASLQVLRGKNIKT
jgi:hypothetical protein